MGAGGRKSQVLSTAGSCSTGRQRKEETSRLTGKNTFWVIRVRVADKGQPRQESLHPNVTFCSLCSHYKINFTGKKYSSCTSCTDALTLLM